MPLDLVTITPHEELLGCRRRMSSCLSHRCYSTIGFPRFIAGSTICGQAWPGSTPIEPLGSGVADAPRTPPS
jgi:hypothetical protein